jgi:thiol-disulfide isomerase/thioredoxin/outer membrane lipoprotein-sorting protein
MTRRSRFLSLCALSLVVAAGLVFADQPVSPDKDKKAPDATAQAGKKDAPPPVQVSDAAKPVLEKVHAAYAKLGGLQASGTWSAEWEIGEVKGAQSAEFTSSYAPPNKFRHETKDDLLFGSTGEKVFALNLKKNQFITLDAPKARGPADDLPAQYAPILKEKNPSLLLAMTDDATPYLAEKAKSIDKADDVKIGGTAYTALKVATHDGADVSVLIDPATNLIRQWSVDLKRALTERGQQNVNKAAMTINYVTVKPEAPAGADAFAWAPPEGAKDAAKLAAAPKEGEANELEGKKAPAFELADLDGKKVKLDELLKAKEKKVIVLDFWATWCPPCRAGLPILDKVAHDDKRKDKVAVYAVNLEEDKKDVAAFKEQTKLKLNVLLDSNGEAGKAYGANAIPQTVIIGKDGKVKKVMVGLHEEQDLAKEIDAAIKD